VRVLILLAVLAFASFTNAVAQEQPLQPAPKWGRFSASVSAGYASDPGWRYNWMENAAQSHWTVGAGAYLTLSQVVKLGIEGGNHFGFTGDDTKSWSNPPWTPQTLVRTQHTEQSVHWLTVSSSFGPVVRRVRPYVSLNVGAYWLREVYESQERDVSGAPDPDHPDTARDRADTLVGGSIGVGMEARRLQGLLGFGVQIRWHAFLEPDANRLDGSLFPSFFTLVAGVTIG
jgi:hypothetical protein